MRPYVAQRFVLSTRSRLHNGRNFAGKRALRRSLQKSERQRGRESVRGELEEFAREEALLCAEGLNLQKVEVFDDFDDYDYDDFDYDDSYEDRYGYDKYEDRRESDCVCCRESGYDWDNDPDFDRSRRETSESLDRVPFDIESWRRRKQ